MMLDSAGDCPANDMPPPTVADLRFASPLDWETIDHLLANHSLVVVAEDGYVEGGVGQAIAARASVGGFECRVLPLGVQSGYIPHATRSEQLSDQGLTPRGIIRSIEEFLRSAEE
jgi:1-deoxy-D-xylulose-5-phosphate synthase